jgi:iron complex transport system permease protein
VRKQRLILAALGILLPASMVMATGFGALAISPGQIGEILLEKIGWAAPSSGGRIAQVWWMIRLPRVLMAVGIGAALGLSGAAMQGLFRNPLADPSIIGISAGAALASSVVIVFGSALVSFSAHFGGVAALSIASFAGAVGATLLIFRLGRVNGKTQVSTLLLAGIAINALAGAFTGLMTFLASETQLRSLTFWTLGSVAGANWFQVGAMTLSLAIALPFLLSQARAFDALSLGEREASHLGIDTERTKTLVIFLTALLVGISVAFCGIIGFVGLVAPHIMRIWGGPRHRFLLPGSALSGALLVLWADTLARTIANPAEVPIGVITALIGAPVFLFLLFQQKQTLS